MGKASWMLLVGDVASVAIVDRVSRQAASPHCWLSMCLFV
jgi:hypothetical protein